MGSILVYQLISSIIFNISCEGRAIGVCVLLQSVCGVTSYIDKRPNDISRRSQKMITNKTKRTNKQN
ncbi:MAG: hypothetical protein Harvfovirus45_8 [Harvfovirus sp.]|uniref:Uncharacterized protein n=1 Tax=Harvfovirus sp. TaxID=2487768 RepID=A0A3G5A5T5_9VIRU|nr:MAG: hypothetical protein Harvfovirus45_8 [Harvfovirus sp.]